MAEVQLDFGMRGVAFLDAEPGARIVDLRAGPSQFGPSFLWRLDAGAARQLGQALVELADVAGGHPVALAAPRGGAPPPGA